MPWLTSKETGQIYLHYQAIYQLKAWTLPASSTQTEF